MVKTPNNRTSNSVTLENNKIDDSYEKKYKPILEEYFSSIITMAELTRKYDLEYLKLQSFKNRYESENNISKKKKEELKKEKYLEILDEHKSTGASLPTLAKKYNLKYDMILDWSKKYGGINLKEKRDSIKDKYQLIYNESKEEQLKEGQAP